MTYAFLIALLGTAVVAVLAFVWRARLNTALGDVKIYKLQVADLEHGMAALTKAAMSATKAWEEERAKLLETIAQDAATNTSRMEEFRALVSKCGGVAMPVLIPWAERVFLDGEGSPSGIEKPK